MKKVIFSLFIMTALIVMMLPTVSPPAVSAANGASVDFKQYANEDDEWINGILQANNSEYHECMSVPQRTILANIPPTAGGEHSLTFSHQATKGGTHAYDWLTAYNQGNDPPLSYDPCGEQIGSTSPNYTAICESLHTPLYSILVDVPDDPFVSKDGSTQDRIDAYEAKFGNRQIKIYGDQPFAAAGLTLAHNVDPGEDDGDSYIEYVLTWTSNSTHVLIEMAGHLALSGSVIGKSIAWGPYLGASHVSGGPYHFKLYELDGASLGRKDNQLMGAVVRPPLVSTVVAHKFNDWVNGDGVQDPGEDDLAGWTMTLYEGSNCTGDALASGTTNILGNVVFDDLVAGTYSVKETLEDNWTNTTALCQQVTVGYCETWFLNFGNVQIKPGIDVTKTAFPHSGTESTLVVFTITVKNPGDLTLNPVKVVDIIPKGMSYVVNSTETTPLPDSYAENPDETWIVTWNNIGSMDPGDTTTIYLEARIDGDELGLLTNNVTAYGTTPEGDILEDTDTADVLALDARISISPWEATNVIGDDHLLTARVEVNDGSGWKGVEDVTVQFTKSGVGTLNPAQSTTNTAGEATTTLTSNVAGNSTVWASADVTVEGVPFNLITDGNAGEFNAPAHKTWVEVGARISISPWEATNVIGDDHVLTARVEVNDGSGWEGAENVTVQFTKSGVGTLNPAQSTTNAAGEATTTLTSNVAGNSTVWASANVTVKGEPFNLITDGDAGEFNAPAKKTWVDARISISPWEATNPIGDDHVLTARVEVNDGSGWKGAEDVTVQFTKSGVGTLNPAQSTTNTTGEATTTLTSNVAGNSTVWASADVTVKGELFNLITDGDTGEFNAPAKKTWVDARISISQEEDTNPVGADHLLTARVEINDGSGWKGAEDVTVQFTKSGVGTLNPAQSTTNTAGEATTILRSTEAGNSTVWASADVTVKGEPFNLITDGEVGKFGGPVKKTWVGARISISPNGTNPVGTTHTFTVHVEKNDSSGWVNAGNVSVTGVIRSGPGWIMSMNPDTTDANGEMTITITSSDPGTTIVDASGTVTVGGLPILVATNGYGAYDPIDNTKRWTDGNGGGYSCSCCSQCSLTVDWEECITTKPLYCSNDKLAVDLLGPSFDLTNNLFLERGTHAPVVHTTTHYVIVVREVKETPAAPENMEAIVVFNITPADAIFDKDIFLTLGVDELPANVLNVTMAYYDDVNGVWELMESEAGGPSGVAELTLSAPINHFSIYGVLAELEPTPPAQPSHFVLSGLTVVPSVEKLSAFVTKTGESVTITASVANDGGQEGTYTVALKLNGETVDTKTVTLGAGQNKQVIFTVSGLDYGQYEVEVAGLSGEFTTARTITWWLIIIIIAVVGLIVWGVVWGTRRRRKAQQQA